MRAFIRRFGTGEAGAVGILVALLLPVLLGFAAFGTDYGAFVLDRQTLRGAVDLAALSAAAHAGDEAAAARRAIERNGQDPGGAEIVLGAVETGADGRATFVPGKPGGAVLVRLRKRTPIFFSALFLKEAPVIEASAVAVAQPLVSLSAGSTLAAVSGGLTEQLTQGLLGARLDLSVLGHAGLVRSRITASGLLEAVAELAGAATGTVGALLDREVEVRLLLRAVALATTREGEASAAADVSRLAGDLARADARIRLGDILALPGEVRDLRIATPSAYLAARLSVASILGAALTRHDEGTALRAGIDLKPLAALPIEVQVGEAMRRSRAAAVGGPGASVETAQVRARLRLQAATALDGRNGLLDLPVELMVAGGRATATAATCSSDPARRLVSVEVLPSVARLEITEPAGALGQVSLSPVRRPATVLNLLGLVRVKVGAVVQAASPQPRTVVFRGAEIGDGTVKTVGSARLVSGLVDALFRNLSVEANLLFIPLPLLPAPNYDLLVRPLLAALAAPLDALLDGLLKTLGVRIGTVDVRVDDLVCNAPRLVV